LSVRKLFQGRIGKNSGFETSPKSSLSAALRVEFQRIAMRQKPRIRKVKKFIRNFLADES
jgi:hypothetical protein